MNCDERFLHGLDNKEIPRDWCEASTFYPEDKSLWSQLILDFGEGGKKEKKKSSKLFRNTRREQLLLITTSFSPPDFFGCMP